MHQNLNMMQTMVVHSGASPEIKTAS